MRKLASIQKIKYVKPIPDADSIETVGILGWECVSNKGEFQPDDLCVYFEIDSLLPEIPEFEFLRKSCWNDSLKKFRLKTIKLRKQLSQGLALPISVFPKLAELAVGDDVSELLGIEKYEPPIPAAIVGDARRFLWPISKTDEVRVQLDDEYKFIETLTGRPYYISLKLDGTSSTFLIDPSDETFHVCGRNFSYQNKKEHSFWQIAERYNIEQGLRDLWNEGRKIAIQGEVVAPGVQKNPLGLPIADLYVFNVVDIPTNTKLCLDDSLSIVERLGLKFVPVLEKGESFGYTVDDLLELAQGKYVQHFLSAKPSQEREGIVIRDIFGTVSFKAINNQFLLKE
jgi:RNA ligase (TIGR02306 family)